MADNTTTVVNSIIEVAEGANFMEIIGSVNEKVSSLIDTYGAEAVNAVLTLLQMKAGWNIIVGFVFAAFTVYFFKKMKEFYKIEKEKSRPWDDFPALLIVNTFCLAVTFSFAFSWLVSFKTWIMLISPKLGLLWMAVSKVIQI